MFPIYCLYFDAISDLQGQEKENTEFEEKVEMYSDVLEKIEKIVQTVEPVTESEIMIGLGLNEERHEEGIYLFNVTLFKTTKFPIFPLLLIIIKNQLPNVFHLTTSKFSVSLLQFKIMFFSIFN